MRRATYIKASSMGSYMHRYMVYTLEDGVLV